MQTGMVNFLQSIQDPTLTRLEKFKEIFIYRTFRVDFEGCSLSRASGLDKKRFDKYKYFE